MQTLNAQGVAMPRLGFGTWAMTGRACQAAVESALALGYRHLDTAEMYGNEEAVGAGIAAAGLPRDELFVTTKVWPEHLAPDALRRAFDASLEKLGLDRVDLYLIHWPAPDMDLGATLEALGRLREAGRTRAIGVANFNVALMRQAVEQIGAPVACNQVEYHAFLGQETLLGYLRGQGIPLVAYCPVARGEVFKSRELQAIGKKHGATPAQVALKWLLDQDGVAAIPKAQSPENQKANLAALSIPLDEEDRRAIAGLRKDRRLVNVGYAPEWDH
jgi:2,5-diketo-D-gluconate reductase B